MTSDVGAGERVRFAVRCGSLRLPVAVVAVSAALAVAGCQSSIAAGAGSRPATLQIVAGENFWGSIASQLAGRAGTVTSIVTDPNADPHSYESSSEDARLFAGADYVVLNGAGYDAWAAKLLAGNPNSKRQVFSVADLLGKKDGDNPHFWYQPDYVSRVTDRIEADLKRLDPRDTAYFDGQRAAFDRGLAPYRSQLAAIRASFSGVPVASTESVFVYLAEYLGLRVISPADFMNAVADGNDPPAPSVAQFEEQLARREAKVFVYNVQTSTAVTTNLRKLAVHAGIPTVAVTETMEPADAAFGPWFDAELGQLQVALAAGSRSGP